LAMCSGPILHIPMLPPVELVRPGQILKVGDAGQWVPMPAIERNAPDTNCRNCGAPPEPVCSYCGTKA
jgi:hypothetical protein